MNCHDLYLASLSPRRKMLLEQLGLSFRVIEINIDEVWNGEPPEEYTIKLALLKARAGRENLPLHEGTIVIGADTVVVLGEDVLLKPENKDDACRILMQLSGQTHHVYTAVGVVGKRELTALSKSKVTFRKLSMLECETYWDTGEPIDKAGAYAIQGKGSVFVKHIEGSYSGIVGLPIYETAELLSKCGIKIF